VNKSAARPVNARHRVIAFVRKPWAGIFQPMGYGHSAEFQVSCWLRAHAVHPGHSRDDDALCGDGRGRSTRFKNGADRMRFHTDKLWRIQHEKVPRAVSFKQAEPFLGVLVQKRSVPARAHSLPASSHDQPAVAPEAALRRFFHHFQNFDCHCFTNAQKPALVKRHFVAIASALEPLLRFRVDAGRRGETRSARKVHSSMINYVLSSRPTVNFAGFRSNCF
jgi:hypothetical protein